jgi:hypothetical protein
MKNASEFNLKTARLVCSTRQFRDANNSGDDTVFDFAKRDIHLIEDMLSESIQ